MAHSPNAPASLEEAAGTTPSAGYVLVPRQLRQDCRRVGINTLKLVLYVADATLGWEFSRWAVLPYRILVAEAGIPNDVCVRRAIEEAQAASLIEVQTTPAGILYAIHRRYWVLARIQPKWHLYKRVPYDPQADPLDEGQPAITIIAQQEEPPDRAGDETITMIAEPLESEAAPPAGTITRIAEPLNESVADNSSAINTIAADYHQDSTLLSLGKQATIIMTAEPLSQSAPYLAPDDAKEIRKEERKEIRKERAFDDADEKTEIDAFVQRYADQQVLQSLLAERQSLQTLQPGQSGWGAAQRRLRALAPEIARIKAMCATQTAEPITTEPEARSSAALTPTDSRSTPDDLPPSSVHGSSSQTSEDAADIAARRLHLLALQQELAQLTRTPSMQLMARQRIPRLEDAIKCLIASLAESA